MARKGENIFHRKDGRWEARYIKGYRPDGSYLYGFLYGKTYQEVKTKRNLTLLNLNNIKNKKNNLNINFSYKIDEWLESQKISVKATTYSYYCNVVNKHIRTELGNLMIKNIDDNVITKFITTKVQNGKLKMSTIKEIVIILKQILSFCNLNIKIKLPKVQKKTISIFNAYEKQILEKYLYDNIDEYAIGILLSLYAGLRIGEVCGLKWKDIDFKTGILHIERTVSRINDDNYKITGNKTKLILIEAKTKNSIREIPINKHFLRLLNKFKDKKDDYCYVLSSNQKFVDPRNYYNHYKKILNKCSLPNYKYHSLRHTFATNCIELGLDPKSLSEILGHSDIKITLSLYVHPSLEIKRKFMDTKFCCNSNF